MVPSVFVLFLRLWESPSPLPSEEIQRKEKEMDDLLVKEIGERRRRLGERGIKLTVVLMASAAALGTGTTGSKLMKIRRFWIPACPTFVEPPHYLPRRRCSS
jgi:hypothetical protein